MKSIQNTLIGRLLIRGNSGAAAFWKKKQSKERLNSLLAEGRAAVRDIDYNSRQAVILQYRTLLELIKKNENTCFGRDHHFSEIHNLSDYRSRVPLSTYEDYRLYIQRMMQGEDGLLCADAPRHYALTTGSIGETKYIPVSQEELDKFTKYTAVMAFGVADEYYRNTTGNPVPSGPGLNAVEWKVAQTQSGTEQGAISGTLMQSMKDYIPWLLSSPWEVVCPEEEMDMKYLKTRLALGYRDLAFMDSVFMTGLVDLMDYIRDNYEMLCRDIWHGRINQDVKVPERVRALLKNVIHPDHDRARELLREFRQGFDIPIIPRIWPRLSWISGIGTGSFFPYVRRMRRYSGKSIPFNNMCYAASESFMAVARHMGDESYVLVPEGGFYEFIPVRGNDDSRILTIEELEVGEDYEIIITNLSGLYRYRLGDVVRVTGFYNETPMIRFIYRKDQIVSIAGEKTNEETLRWAVDQFSLSQSIYINDFSIYADTAAAPGHYVLLLEPERTVPFETIAYCRDVMEEKLMQANPTYGEMVRSGALGPLELIFLQLETYKLYRDLMIVRGASANQLKPVRVIDTPQKKNFFFRLKEIYTQETEP